MQGRNGLLKREVSRTECQLEAKISWTRVEKLLIKKKKKGKIVLTDTGVLNCSVWGQASSCQGMTWGPPGFVYAKYNV